MLSSGSSEKLEDEPPINPAAIAALAGALSSADNKNAELLRSLKPYLSPKRQQKTDEAIKLLKLLSMLPMLRDSGLLDNLF